MVRVATTMTTEIGAGAMWTTTSVARAETVTATGVTIGVSRVVTVTAAVVTTNAVWKKISGTIPSVVFKLWVCGGIKLKSLSISHFF